MNTQQVANQLTDALKGKSFAQQKAITDSFVPKFKAAEAPPQGLSLWVRRALPSFGIAQELVDQLAQALA